MAVLFARVRRLAVVAGAMLAVLGAAGCGSDDAPSGDASTAATATTDTAATDPAPPTETEPSTEASGSAEATGSDVPMTVEGAIARFEEFLHALGNEDMAVICEIVGPAMAAAPEAGSCEEAYTAVFQMIPPEQKVALTTATVDPAGVRLIARDRVTIPQAAVVSDVPLDELGDYTLAYQNANWFIVE